MTTKTRDRSRTNRCWQPEWCEGPSMPLEKKSLVAAFVKLNSFDLEAWALSVIGEVEEDFQTAAHSPNETGVSVASQASATRITSPTQRVTWYEAGDVSSQISSSGSTILIATEHAHTDVVNSVVPPGGFNDVGRWQPQQFTFARTTPSTPLTWQVQASTGSTVTIQVDVSIFFNKPSGDRFYAVPLLVYASPLVNINVLGSSLNITNAVTNTVLVNDADYFDSSASAFQTFTVNVAANSNLTAAYTSQLESGPDGENGAVFFNEIASSAPAFNWNVQSTLPA